MINIQKHSPLSTLFKNAVPFQPYLSFIPSSAPHIKQSDLLSLWFKKTCLSVLPFTPGPLSSSEYSFCPHNTCIYRTNTRCSLRTHYTVTFFLKPLLVTPLFSLCLFTTSVPLFYSCSILQLLDLIVLRDS